MGDRHPRRRPIVRDADRLPLRSAISWLVLALAVALSGCSSVVAGTPKAANRGGASGGPIYPSQLVDLLTPSSSISVLSGSPLSEQDMQSAMFAGADPADCQGVVAFGGYALFP